MTDRRRIAWELERTAMGDGYYGDALRAAKEFPADPVALPDGWVAVPRGLLQAARNALHYMRLHKYADQAWADDLEAAIVKADAMLTAAPRAKQEVPRG